MYCKQCGANSPDDCSYCLNCGAKFENAVPNINAGPDQANGVISFYFVFH
ncbi:MAG: hypothetical protein PUC65_05225 [Clostridiales bacterium]|nr:hypothetical protein [Clostridiales bacterium]